MKKTALILFVIGALILMSSCKPASTPPGAAKNPVVTITMDDDSTIVIELYPDKAPNTVANFVSLIQSGFYDGLIFHRTSSNFMIQGGDPLGNGTGGPGYSIKGEFSANGFAQNDLTHKRGVISMARSNSMDSAGSQFFIMVVDYVGASMGLDGKYAAFGKVTSGMDTVDDIASGPNSGGREMTALEPRTMKSVTVETYGVEYKVETTAER